MTTNEDPIMQWPKDEICSVCGETNGHTDDCEVGTDTEIEDTELTHFDIGGEG
jgi:hypothetical protein